ncbi:rod shape-determining protein MreC [Roseibacillus ishigakijimensis]|uniref:Cell shape-determining protein MreC n=1 Tax=Roseibacillus ishigakijimensis TaxID=454146 RepID=A0A934VKV5_9BACT|nr:rod shape-determining protein MreC [Roseibacillus ishigakijimensis]MBK1834049.1 rod shape-determining protein MreC [Roseibacillus ishigakijimensis]
MKPLTLITLLVFLAAGTWVLTWSPVTVRKVQETYYRAIGPFLKSGSNIEKFSRDFVREVEHSENLQRKLEAIQADYGELKIIEGRFRELERENQQLNQALGFQKRTNFDVKAAKVIKRQPSTWWDTLTINQGEKADIGTQLTVLAEGGLVGRVDQSFEDISNVILITDESCQVSVYVEGSPEKGILSGERGEYGLSPLLRLRYLSRNAPIQAGMKVFTTGRGGIFPPDIQVGTITEVIAGSYESEALVKPSVDLQNLAVVFVLQGDQGVAGEEVTTP